MRKTFNIAVAGIVAGAFLFASVFCCSAHDLARGPKAQASSCCAKADTQSPTQKADCGSCPLALKSVDTAHAFSLTAPFSNIVFSGIAPLAFKPAQALLKPASINGPPGPLCAVPLYTQFHSLRI